MTLKELGIGQKGIILSVGGSGALRQHFLDMGLIRGAEVTVVKYAPMGDPIELKIHGYELTIRLDDAEKIEVKEIKSEEKEKENRYNAENRTAVYRRFCYNHNQNKSHQREYQVHKGKTAFFQWENILWHINLFN